MKNFAHISYNERRKIYSSLCEGKSKKEIAIMLERTTLSISREVRPNSDAQDYYLYPGEATNLRKRGDIGRNQRLRTIKIYEIISLRSFICDGLLTR